MEIKYLDDNKRRTLGELYVMQEVITEVLKHIGDLSKEDLYLYLIDFLDEVTKEIDILWKEEEELAEYEANTIWDYEQRYEE